MIHKLAPDPRKDRGEAIVVGLVNNMPDTALRTTERQFRDLLTAASSGKPVRLRLFAIPEIPRGEAGRSHVRDHCEDIGALWESQVDGLIVTGNEPRMAALEDEPYWSTLAKLVDWAEERTASTVWSCLAAHAAVRHLDGIERHALGDKLFGVFESVRIADHPILAGTPLRWGVPHSRYNELPEDALRARGYRLLTRSVDAGADMFVRHRQSLFLFLQGHPEYDHGALLREYRRDVGRYLAGERGCYPEIPRFYISKEAADALVAFRERAIHHRGSGLLAEFPGGVAERGLTHSWRAPAVSLYANWLSYLSERRQSGAIAAPDVQRECLAL